MKKKKIHYLSFPKIKKLFTCFRCYDDELANKTIEEVREIYSHYSNPSCTPYQGVSKFSFLNNDHPSNSTTCNRWIYELDHGYKSMSSEVSFEFLTR